MRDIISKIVLLVKSAIVAILLPSCQRAQTLDSSLEREEFIEFLSR